LPKKRILRVRCQLTQCLAPLPPFGASTLRVTIYFRAIRSSPVGVFSEGLGGFVTFYLALANAPFRTDLNTVVAERSGDFLPAKISPASAKIGAFDEITSPDSLRTASRGSRISVLCITASSNSGIRSSYRKTLAISASERLRIMACVVRPGGGEAARTFPDRRGFDSIEEVVNDARQDRA
jgi:hypothetical protein